MLNVMPVPSNPLLHQPVHTGWKSQAGDSLFQICDLGPGPPWKPSILGLYQIFHLQPEDHQPRWRAPRIPSNLLTSWTAALKGAFSQRLLKEAVLYAIINLFLSNYFIINVWVLFKIMLFLWSLRIKYYVLNIIRYYKPKDCQIVLWFISLLSNYTNYRRWCFNGKC